jgi:hypothetical protein
VPLAERELQVDAIGDLLAAGDRLPAQRCVHFSGHEGRTGPSTRMRFVSVRNLPCLYRGARLSDGVLATHIMGIARGTSGSPMRLATSTESSIAAAVSQGCSGLRRRSDRRNP